MSVVLYGCEIWSLKLREERRLRVFENRVQRRIYGLIRVIVILMVRSTIHHTGILRGDVTRFI
jgi:hypothetical protein